MTEHASFHPAYALTARSGVSGAAARSWRSSLRRGPSVLVPVDLQALVVSPGDTTDYADVGVHVLDKPVDAPRAPQPFTARAPRGPGTYLHWALPDGLTQTLAPDASGALRWRALPNRWVVCRLLSAFPYEVKLWLVESDRGRSFDLDGWTEEPVASSGRTPRLAPSELTTMVGGDPGWAAVYDSVEDRFAFHDRWVGLTGPPAGAVFYTVMGWYSEPELDPLHAPQEAGGFRAALRELGWTVDAARLAAMQAASERMAAAAALVGLSSEAAVLTDAADFAQLGRTEARKSQPVPWWPRQCLFHGVVYGVHADGQGPPDPRPAPSQIDVAVGSSSTEGVAALFAARQRDRNAEFLQSAFSFGLADALGTPDGIPRVEEELHARAFEARPGGERVERVLAGDPFTAVRPERAPTPATDSTLAAFDGKTVRFEFLPDGERTVTDLHITTTRPDRAAAPPDPRRFIETRRALPRLFAPQDPVAVLGGVRRSLRHGYDGRFSPDERLACRLTGDTVSRFMGVVRGTELIDRGVRHGGVPPEVDDLLIEAAIENPFLGPLSEEVFSKLGLGQFFGFGAYQGRLTAEAGLYLWSLTRPAQAAALQSLSLKDGIGASPAGITIWEQAWVPLHLEWELRLDNHDHLTGWQLDELDYTAPPGTTLDAAKSTVLSGRSLLVSASPRALSEQISAFLDAEDKLDLAGEGRIDAAVEAQLQTLSEEAGVVDVLSAGFDGLRHRLLGFTSDTAGGAAGTDVPDAPPTEPLEALRAGFAVIERLRIVDAFGRTVPLIHARTPAPALSRALEHDPAGGIMVLRPRLNQPARLMLRMVDAADDEVDATVDQSAAETVSPLAGWLLADHADGAVELFAPDGGPLGQLMHDSLTRAVGWEGPPGDRGPVGASPASAFSGVPRLQHLAGLVRGLLERDSAIRASVINQPSETPLEGLLRVVDTTSATIGLSGVTGSEHFAQLVGRPIAVVRAVLRLDVEDEPEWPTLTASERAARADAWEDLRAREFAVRLGALTRLDDGLLGVFVDDDYSVLRPVHESVVARARPSGPRQGDLAGIAASTQAQPIDTPFVSGSATVHVRPGAIVRLTLLMDPGAKVHATSGLLPRKAITLLREWIGDALARVVPSFRVGPVLVDPTTISMPLAAALGKDQQWSRREAPTSWRHDPLAAATQQAYLPDTAAVLQEGYLRVHLED